MVNFDIFSGTTCEVLIKGLVICNTIEFSSGLPTAYLAEQHLFIVVVVVLLSFFYSFFVAEFGKILLLPFFILLWFNLKLTLKHCRCAF